MAAMARLSLTREANGGGVPVASDPTEYMNDSGDDDDGAGVDASADRATHESRSRSRSRDDNGESAGSQDDEEMFASQRLRQGTLSGRDRSRDRDASEQEFEGGFMQGDGALSRLPDASRDELLESWMILIPAFEREIDDPRERRKAMYVAFGKPPYYFLGMDHTIVPAWAKAKGALQPIAQTRESIRIAPHFNGCFRTDLSERIGCRPGGYYTFMVVGDLAKDSVARAIVLRDVLPLVPGATERTVIFCYTRMVPRKAKADRREFVRTRVQSVQKDTEARAEALSFDEARRQQTPHASTDIISCGDTLYVEDRRRGATVPMLQLYVIAARARSTEERYVVCTLRQTVGRL